ncbi:MAG: carboxypeptidase-like regulatory domain-containing protein [bacterium]
MKLFSIILTILLCSQLLVGQQSNRISGVVREKSEQGIHLPIIGANVYWLGTATGTFTDTSGAFTLARTTAANRLVIRSVGFKSDTVTVLESRQIEIELQSEATEVREVEVVGERSGTYLNYLSTQKIQVMTEKELFKAACCNLSESFQTNPSIDVSFTDAITGMKQIEMLGLAGTYSQITLENFPAVRGLTSNVGLTYIPGSWMESIQVSKGVGSVANGYESITGQINVELRKPRNEEEKTFFFNFYGNNEQRFEGNLNYRLPLSKEFASLTLAHFSSMQHHLDGNGDNFLDTPLSKTLNIYQRFQVHSDALGLEGQFGIQFVKDEKKGGTLHGYTLDQPARLLHLSEYGFGMNSQQLRIHGKTGVVFSGNPYRSLGVQWSLSDFRQDYFFGQRNYTGRERTGYLNILYQANLDSTIHSVRIGLSFLFDEFKETFSLIYTQRAEKVPGAFAEYTYAPIEEFTLVAGIRADRHNLFGTFITPRIHVRYTPQEDWIFRLIAGRGARTANVLSENAAYFASARTLSTPFMQGGYPFNQEVAWNFGFNVTRYFLYKYREGTITFDFYRTAFDHQVVADLDQHPQQVSFSNLNGESYSNSIQVEINYPIVERLETRLAYRHLDVKQTIAGVLRERPFVAKDRAFINLAYSTEREDPMESQMLYDVTVQWYGNKRLPDTRLNPQSFQVSEYSPDFVLANAQITRSFFTGLDLYLGIENLFNFRQSHPILDPTHPNGSYFDGALIWGPVTGRMIYTGLRWRI